jgi:hypothetical protein
MLTHLEIAWSEFQIPLCGTQILGMKNPFPYYLRGRALKNSPVGYFSEGARVRAEQDNG